MLNSTQCQKPSPSGRRDRSTSRRSSSCPRESPTSAGAATCSRPRSSNGRTSRRARLPSCMSSLSHGERRNLGHQVMGVRRCGAIEPHGRDPTHRLATFASAAAFHPHALASTHPPHLARHARRGGARRGRAVAQLVDLQRQGRREGGSGTHSARLTSIVLPDSFKVRKSSPRATRLTFGRVGSCKSTGVIAPKLVLSTATTAAAVLAAAAQRRHDVRRGHARRRRLPRREVPGRRAEGDLRRARPGSRRRGSSCRRRRRRTAPATSAASASRSASRSPTRSGRSAPPGTDRSPAAAPRSHAILTSRACRGDRSTLRVAPRSQRPAGRRHHPWASSSASTLAPRGIMTARRTPPHSGAAVLPRQAPGHGGDDQVRRRAVAALHDPGQRHGIVKSPTGCVTAGARQTLTSS